MLVEGQKRKSCIGAYGKRLPQFLPSKHMQNMSWEVFITVTAEVDSLAAKNERFLWKHQLTSCCETSIIGIMSWQE